jgi:hypothetical protein
MNEDGELDFAVDERDDDAVSKKSDKERVLLGWCMHYRQSSRR